MSNLFTEAKNEEKKEPDAPADRHNAPAGCGNGAVLLVFEQYVSGTLLYIQQAEAAFKQFPDDQSDEQCKRIEFGSI
jgi:hypothetical protein